VAPGCGLTRPDTVAASANWPAPTGIVCVGVVAIVGIARCTVVPLLVPRPDAVIEPPSCCVFSTT